MSRAEKKQGWGLWVWLAVAAGVLYLLHVRAQPKALSKPGSVAIPEGAAVAPKEPALSISPTVG